MWRSHNIMVTKNNNNNIITTVNTEGCFDLQFRKDVRHERPKAPAYYRWKIQFVITEKKANLNLLERIKNVFGCGKIYVSGNQIRYSVQNIDEINAFIVPYFKKHTLVEKKKKDFDLWAKAVEIIYKNKRKYLGSWKKDDFKKLIEIQKSIQKYKDRPKRLKWIKIADEIAKTAFL